MDQNSGLRATLRVWDLKTGKERQIIQGHEHHVYFVAFNSDNRFAISGSGDNTLRIWDLETGKCIASFRLDTIPICVSTKDSLVAVGKSDGQIGYFDLRLS